MFTNPCHSQLSGEVDLGGGTAKPEGANEVNIKEITVTGIGDTIEAAEKQALASAIRQAVGAYMDSKTIFENEEVIQDRILSVSNAFVEKYEVVGQPKKLSDGLIEITVIARVKTNQVVQALKENNLISGEVAGQNLWAEASTKVMNAQDAVTMLETKIPELIKSVVTITPLDKEGKPLLTKDASGNAMPSTAPAVVDSDDLTGEATLTWYFEMGVDKSYYAETLFPLVNKCLDAIMGDASKKMEVKLLSQTRDRAQFTGQNYLFEKDSLPIKQSTTWLPLLSDLRNSYIQGSYGNSGLVFIKSLSRNLDSMDVISYQNPKNNIIIQSGEAFPDGNACLASLSIQLLASDGEKLAAQIIDAWQPFSCFGNTLGIVGPFSECSRESLFNLTRPIIQKVSIKVPMDILKEIKKVDVSLQPSEVKLTLQPNRQ